MTLAAGFQLGPYQIQSPLGAGGMGEVYKARDTRLERVVAIKILPDALAADPKFRDRFDREARTISQLDHPHICAVFDVGEAPSPESPTGSSTPIRYLVMQYLEGQTLADRIAKGPLPPGEALTIAIQIADALRGAHRAGIVHRDLKPANVMLTRSGVKLLDFGLAKTSLSAEAAGLTALPTSAQPLTEQGTILGTFQYMAPEQLEGLEADARTDIFAFGAVLYETLTGKKAFGGASRASVIGAIMHVEPPPITTLQPTAPRAIDRIVQKCLAKDRDERWQSAADLHDSLRWAAEASDTLNSPNQVAPAVRGRAPARREALAWMAAAGFGLATIGLAGAALRQRALDDAPVVRTSIVVPNGVVIATAAPNRFALSPDGTRIAIVAVSAGQRARLFVRLLDSLAVLPLAGTEGASGPFWSPDSRRIGFFADGKLKTIGVSGGTATILADASALPGGAWNRDDVILFTAADLNGLSRVSAKGGPVSSATALDAAKAENAHLAPYFLPDGDHFFYFSRGSANGPADVGGTYIGSLASKDSKRRVDVGPSAKYAQGAVFFMRDSTLLAQPFNVDRLEPTGDPVTVGEQVDLGGSTGRAGGFSVSDTGVVAYQMAADVRTQLAWFDRAGRQLTTVGELADQIDIDLSPDGTKAVVSLADPVGSSRDLWIYELARGLRTRFTFDPGDEVRGTWFPDGSRIVFGAGSVGKFTVSERTLTGASSEILTATQVFALPTSVSPDGRFVLYADGTPQRSLSSDEWLLPLDGTRKPSPFVQTPFADASGAFSPDGRWVAYSSNESGRNEVYVTRFPQAGRKWQVSAAGGAFPRWRRDGKELFYVSPDNKLLAAGVDGSREAFDVGAVSPLFSVRFRTSGYLGYRGDGNYAVSADGRQFLLNVANAESAPGPITLVVNWAAAIRK